MVEEIRWSGVILGGFVIGLSFATCVYYLWRFHGATGPQPGPLSRQRLLGILSLRIAILLGSVAMAIILLRRIADHTPFSGFSILVIFAETCALVGLVAVHLDDQRQMDEARGREHNRRDSDFKLTD